MSSTGDLLIFDSVTALNRQSRGRAVLTASHGGTFAAYLAARAEIGAVILCDAGIGRECAGTAGLAYLETLQVPAATVGHRSARIGDGADCAHRGIISCVKGPGRACGITVGMRARAALDRLTNRNLSPCQIPLPKQETRHEIFTAQHTNVRVSALDSVSLVTADDEGQIILTGSHGGLLGGRPETAVKYPVFAAVYNDADRGIDDAGISRLVALDARGIAGATVSAWSARIGDGLSTYEDGYISAVNDTARRFGAQLGISAVELTRRLVAARFGD